MFNFRLAPIEKVDTFGSKGNQNLHWFGLTDGCYWLQVGDIELFRYSREILQTPQWMEYDCSPYVNYYIVRLWEGLLDMLPQVLTPVPEILWPTLATPDAKKWRDYVDNRWVRALEDKKADDIYILATEWQRELHLDTAYLKSGSEIWLWNDGENIHIEWDNRSLEIEGLPVWEAQMGSESVPIKVFLEAVRSFDKRFIEAMQERVNQVLEHWPRPDVFIDKQYLVSEHQDRALWLDRALKQAAEKKRQNWDAIIDAVARVEGEI